MAISVLPWEIALEPADSAGISSARNRLPGTVSTVLTLGNRVRVGIDAAQPLVAEVTPGAREELGLVAGKPVIATWKATATRIVAGR